MAIVSLQAASLRDAASKMGNAADKIEKALQNIDTIISDIPSVWDDPNSKQYLSRFNDLKTEFPAFKNAIRSYGEFLNRVVDTYQRDFIGSVSESVRG